MNRRHALLATAATAILLAACSSSPDSPPPFAEAPADLAARLAADLGVPTHVEMKDGATFILPRGQTRPIAASARKGEDVAGWLQKYSSDLGVGPLHDVTEGTDAAGTTHV